MKFKIDRSKWRCGNEGEFMRGKGYTCLLNEEGHRCCLGHVASQLGIGDEDLMDKPTPGDVTELHETFLCKKTQFYSDSDLSLDAVRINDHEFKDDSERESDLTELFRNHGHEIEFMGQY